MQKIRFAQRALLGFHGLERKNIADGSVGTWLPFAITRGNSGFYSGPTIALRIQKPSRFKTPMSLDDDELKRNWILKVCRLGRGRCAIRSHAQSRGQNSIDPA